MNRNTSLSNSLITCGSKLSDLLRVAKRSPLESGKIHGKVKEAIQPLLDDLLQRAEADPRCMSSHVLDKLREILQKFIEADKDNAQFYRELDETVKNMKDHHGTSSSSLQWYDETSYSTRSNLPEFEFESKYKKLSNEEKRCLFYFSLFPEGAELKKRELIYWWLGVFSLAWHSQGGVAEGGYILAKFVDEGFIHHLVKPNKFFSRYRMRTNVRLQVLEKVTQELPMRVVHPTQQGSFMELYFGKKSNNQSLQQSNNIDALLNIGVNTFDQKTFDRISELENALILHLGSWKGTQQDKEEDATGNYIVVEDSEPLQKALKQLEKGKVRFLSLQGISGIVDLPDSISNLKELVVLDLRACHNLESLPQGIGSLLQLVHLDLSECYLLEHIPKEIASLSKLRVLMGFVINPHPNPSSSADFSDLSKLKLLIKLTVRSRIMSFPTRQDLEVLCEMVYLKTLRITWVKQTQGEKWSEDFKVDRFPLLLKKLELQAVPQQTSSRLLELISKQRNNSLEKLYIRGALGELELHKYIFPHVKQVRLRYLSKLEMNWDAFMQSFPNLIRLQIFECKLTSNFPCDKNGVWERKSF